MSLHGATYMPGEDATELDTNRGFSTLESNEV
jgi:hypothetical protein